MHYLDPHNEHRLVLAAMSRDKEGKLAFVNKITIVLAYGEILTANLEYGDKPLPHKMPTADALWEIFGCLHCYKNPNPTLHKRDCLRHNSMFTVNLLEISPYYTENKPWMQATCYLQRCPTAGSKTASPVAIAGGDPELGKNMLRPQQASVDRSHSSSDFGDTC